MIFSASSIRTRNIITPFYERTTHRGMTFGLGPAGYDVRIAQSMMLFAGQFTLASTIERFMMPRNVMGFVHDKSTWARRGLSLFNTVIEPGWQGHLTLEMTAHCHGGDGGPLVFEAGDPIAQVVFQLVDAVCPSYEGKYQNQPDRPVPALYQRCTSAVPALYEVRELADRVQDRISGKLGKLTQEQETDLARFYEEYLPRYL